MHSWPAPPGPGSVAPIASAAVPRPKPAKPSKTTSGIVALHRIVAEATRERAAAPEVIEDDIIEIVPAPPPVSSRRPSPVAVVRQMIGELEIRATVSQAAGVCAAVLRGTLRARAVVIHAYDPRSGDLRVIGADETGALVGTSHSADDDIVASTVLANGKPTTLRFDGELPRFAPARLRQIGADRSLLAVPVMASSGCVGIVEVIDVDDALQNLAVEACQRAADALVRYRAPHKHPTSLQK
jgi:hypothetical protein